MTADIAPTGLRRPAARPSAAYQSTAGRWDADLPDLVWAVRAGLHTRVEWRRGGAMWFGDLDGPAVLGPMAGWLMTARVEPVHALRQIVWRVTVHAARETMGEQVGFSLRRADQAEHDHHDEARQAFEDLCRGANPVCYLVSAPISDSACVQMSELPALARAAMGAAEASRHPDWPDVVTLP